MARISTSRILWGVQYQLLSSGRQCVADWFTESSEAHECFAQIKSLDRVYKNVELVCIRLPDNNKEHIRLK